MDTFFHAQTCRRVSKSRKSKSIERILNLHAPVFQNLFIGIHRSSRCTHVCLSVTMANELMALSGLRHKLYI